MSGIGEGLTGVFYPTGLLDILFSLFCWQTGATPVGGVDGAGGDADQLPGGEGPHELLRRQAPRLRRPLRRKSAKGPAGVSLPSPPCPPPRPTRGRGCLATAELYGWWVRVQTTSSPSPLATTTTTAMSSFSPGSADFLSKFQFRRPMTMHSFD